MHDEKNTVNGVIERGYEIYDQWKNNKYKSREIVSSVQNSVAVTKAGGTRLEALSYLFALNLRIKERYKSIVRCILLFFAFCRETSLLKQLKRQLNVPYNGDVRTLIEVYLSNAFGKAENNEGNENGQNKGGKKLIFNGENDLSTDKVESGADVEANIKEKKLLSNDKAQSEEEATEDLPAELPNEKEKTSSNKQKFENPSVVDYAMVKNEKNIADKGILLSQNNEKQETSFLKQENSGFENKEEPIINRIKENQGNGDAVDMPPLPIEEKSDTPTDKTGFSDEIVMDSLTTGSSDFVGNGDLYIQNDGSQIFNNIQGAVSDGDKEKSDMEKNAYLYDKRLLNLRMSNNQEERGGSHENIREPIKVEMTLDREAGLSKAINENMPANIASGLKAAYEAEMRYQDNNDNGAHENQGLKAQIK